jgi:glycosyltransferase involved in cell wall biosynthesis
MALRIQVLSQLDPSIARTNSIADLRLCAGLAASGHDVELIVPVTSPAPHSAEGLFELYEIERSFEIRHAALPRDAAERARMVRLVGHHARLAFGKRGARAVISRDVRLLAPYLAASRLPSKELVAVPWLHEFRDRALERWACRHARCVLATNSAILRSLEARGVDPASTFVTGNPVPERRVAFGRSCSRREARARVALDGNRPIVAYTGKLYSGMRELDYLLEAAQRLPQHLFVLTGGQPPVITRLKQSLATRDIRNVHLVGLLERPEEVRFYQQAADVLVSYYSVADHPYADHNLPNKLAEYMTTGNPIVAADFPAIRDLLSDRNAVLVPPDQPDRLVEGLASAIGDGSERSLRARDEIAVHTSEAVCARLGEFLSRCGARRASEAQSPAGEHNQL